jgi:multiple sugar transport system ATP-binding protein
MAKVELKNVWKVYGRTRAVQGATFVCRDKTLTAILGPSGAGKTSILKMIAGIEPITHGEILYDGISVEGVDSCDLNVAMVFESYALYPNINVYDNIAFPLRAPCRARQFTPEAIRERITKVAETVHMDMLLDRLPKELSGGQRQRVAMCRALVRNPRVLLMDEPIAHLDAKLRHQMRGELRTLTRSLDTTILYVSHDYREALAIADNVIAINKGIIQQIATPKEIFENPASDFVADLIGEPPMNLIDCRISREGGKTRLTFEGFWVTLDERMEQRLNALNVKGDLVRLGVRPIHVKLVDNAIKGEGYLPAEVYVVELLGNRNIISLKIGDGTLVQSVVSSSVRPEVGDMITVQFSSLHIFEPSATFERTLTL